MDYQIQKNCSECLLSFRRVVYHIQLILVHNSGKLGVVSQFGTQKRLRTIFHHFRYTNLLRMVLCTNLVRKKLYVKSTWRRIFDIIIGAIVHHDIATANDGIGQLIENGSVIKSQYLNDVFNSDNDSTNINLINKLVDRSII